LARVARFGIGGEGADRRNCRRTGALPPFVFLGAPASRRLKKMPAGTPALPKSQYTSPMTTDHGVSPRSVCSNMHTLNTGKLPPTFD
jgi:hypothetical protein